MAMSLVPEHKKKEFVALALAFALLAGAIVLVAWVSGGAFPTIFLFAVGLSLGIALFARFGHFGAALRIAEVGFALILAISVRWSVLRFSGAFLAFIPTFVLFCRYFDGQRAFVVSSLWSGLCYITWYLLVGIDSLGASVALNFGATIGIDLVLTQLAGSGLDFALVDKDRLLHELHHRMRNLFQILGGLASFRDKGETSGVLSLQVLAIERIQEALAASADSRTLSLDKPLSLYASDLAGSLGNRLSIRTRVEGRIWAEKAQPLILIISEILANEGPRLIAEGAKSMDLELVVSEGEGHFRVMATGEQGRPFELHMDFGDLGMGLLAQLKARPSHGVDRLVWEMDFDAGEGASSTKKDGEISRKSRQGSQWSSILGKANKSRSRLWLKKAGQLAGFNLVLGGTLLALVAIWLVLGGPPRMPALVLLPFLLLSVLLIRAGHLSSPAILTLAAISITMSWGVLAGPGHERGVNLVLAQAVIVFGLYFLGSLGGLVAIVWAIGINLVWYLVDGHLGLPFDDWLVIVVASLLFILVIAFVMLDFRKDLEGKEALALELQRRTVTNLDILLEAIATDVESDPTGPLTATTQLLHTLSLAHTLVWERAFAGTPDMQQLLKALIDGQDQDELYPRGIAITLEAEGSLGIERAQDAVILLAELRFLGSRDLGERGSISFRFHSGDRRAELVMEVRDEKGSPAGLNVGSERILELLEDQVGGRRLSTLDGSYSISFGT